MAMCDRRVSGLVSILAAATAVVALGAAPQERPKVEPTNVSNKNVVVIRGCVEGSMLVGIEAREYTLYVPERLRATGNRAMRAAIREANGHYVEVVGAIKGSTSAATGALVKDTGKTKIYVGGSEHHLNDPLEMDERKLPAQIDVTSLKEISGQCKSDTKS